jgi:hypothetical protein
LRDELAAARSEISQIKEEREERDQQLVTAILNRVRAEYEEVTRKVRRPHLVASRAPLERRRLPEIGNPKGHRLDEVKRDKFDRSSSTDRPRLD